MILTIVFILITIYRNKDRFQVIKLMKELENDGVKIYRQGRNSYYYI